MGVSAFKRLFIGLVIFAISVKLIDSMITGTDTGSVLIQTVLLIVIAAVILIGLVASMGNAGKE